MDVLTGAHMSFKLHMGSFLELGYHTTSMSMSDEEWVAYMQRAMIDRCTRFCEFISKCVKSISPAEFEVMNNMLTMWCIIGQGLMYMHPTHCRAEFPEVSRQILRSMGA